ncbi:MAG: hypothetical protein ABJN42_12300 [Roseibium sp.]|uniref:hypothetical protein n=1 Tax=Roseibium sp. TaxID=1936156 RepID=UPI0032985D8B
MGTLYFSCDGVLRRHMAVWNARKGERISKDVPLKAIEAAVDPDVFLKSLHDEVVLEPGLTVLQFFENLAPWSKAMIGVGCMDFPAFLEEARRKADTRTEECDRIEIYWHASISPVPKFERPKDAGKRGVLDFGAPMRTGELMVEHGWDMDAILTPEGRKEYDGAHAVSLGFTPLSEWSHLPLCISQKAVIRDTTPCPTSKVYLGTDLSLTRPDHQNVEVKSGANGQAFSHDIAIAPPTPTFFDAIVRGLLWEIGFHYSPCTRDDIGEKLLASVSELKNPGQTQVEKDDAEDDMEYRVEMNRLQNALTAADDLGLPVRAPGDPRLEKT